jgi:hypothetical protein
MSARSIPAAAGTNRGVAGWETMTVAVSRILSGFFPQFLCASCEGDFILRIFPIN